MSVAPDGSPVALYLAVPGDDEASLIHRAIPEQSAVLELGCGVGRVTRHLAALGHSVTAVDNSSEMLAAFPRLAGVATVLAEIASLDLSERFDAVLLASHMINDADGPAFLRAAARHVDRAGVVLVQRHEPGWVDSAQPVASERLGVGFELTDVAHPERGAVSATAVYTVDGVSYRQPFVAYEVDDERLAELAAQVGLRVDGYVEGDPSWVKLTPRDPGRIASRLIAPRHARSPVVLLDAEPDEPTISCRWWPARRRGARRCGTGGRRAGGTAGASRRGTGRAAPDDRRSEVEVKLVGKALFDGLSGDVAAAHDDDVLLAGRGAGLFDGDRHVVDERNRSPRTSVSTASWSIKAIAFKLADMKMRTDAARLLVWRASWMAGTGKAFSAGEGSMAKLYAGENAVWVTDQAIQILGGYSYIRDHPVERWHRDARIFTIFEGTSEIQRLTVARATPVYGPRSATDGDETMERAIQASTTIRVAFPRAREVVLDDPRALFREASSVEERRAGGLRSELSVDLGSGASVHQEVFVQLDVPLRRYEPAADGELHSATGRRGEVRRCRRRPADRRGFAQRVGGAARTAPGVRGDRRRDWSGWRPESNVAAQQQHEHPEIYIG